MKKLTILLLSTSSLCASAQTKKNDIKQSVSDNGKTMHITVKSNLNGKSINYDHTFMIKGMNQQQKDALLKHVNDSLGIKTPPAPPAPHLPASASASVKNNSSHSLTETKTVKDDGKTMHIVVNSNKGGKEVNYNKTFPVKGMSKQQKEVMVKKITDSLGVSK